MSALWDAGPRWGRWVRAWVPVVTVAAIWTILTLPQGEVFAAALFFGICFCVGVAAARDDGSTVSWSLVPVAVTGLTSLMGPLIDVPVATLTVGAVMALTTPPVRILLGRRRAGVSLDQLSDWALDARWDDSEVQLRRSHRPDKALAVVLARAEILDELVRRGRPPDPDR
jgi:hypothetical protein